VAKELGDPDRRYARIRVAAVVFDRIEQRAVRVEEAVLDRQRDLEVPARQAERVLVVVADDVLASAEPRIVVQPRNAERVVVVPQLRRLLLVGIVVDLGLEERAGLLEAAGE